MGREVLEGLHVFQSQQRPLSRKINKQIIAHPVRNIPARFWEWLTEIVRHSAILGWAAQHFESDSQNLTELFLLPSEALEVNGPSWKGLRYGGGWEDMRPGKLYWTIGVSMPDCGVTYVIEAKKFEFEVKSYLRGRKQPQGQL